MPKVLLIEPDYRSKFPPLGLMRIATYHRDLGDTIVFKRGLDHAMRELKWHRIYVASLFTWELPRTVKAVKFYENSLSRTGILYVGGIGVTLLPDYVRERCNCEIVLGQLDKPNMLGRGSRAIAKLTPDYHLLHGIDYEYSPKNAYFVRITQGCVRSCPFCAVPRLEPRFEFLREVKKQISDVDRDFGSMQDLVVLDNNILGISGIGEVFAHIRDLGFGARAKRNGRKRRVDFNQGLDARLISRTPSLAKGLGSLCLSPVRLAFDFPGIEKSYRHAITLLHDQGLRKFTNYMLFNFQDTPRELYDRINVNADLNSKLDVEITGFPMRFIPMDNVHRNHVAKGWRWRYLRGIQCVLLATRGLVSPNAGFVDAAFGRSYDEFLEILSMPDHYIIFREAHRTNGIGDWRRRFRRLSTAGREDFLDLLEALNNDRKRREKILSLKRYRALIEHYYPDGRMPPQVESSSSSLK